MTEARDQVLCTRGFALLELAIVVTIIGVIAGTILVAHEMIRAAEIRSTLSQVTQLQQAVNTFRDKYWALPGDFTGAEALWGSDTNCPNTPMNNQTPRKVTCNGDGDGYIGRYVPPFPTANEWYRAIQQLADAGLIDGLYSGVSGPGRADGAYAVSLPGINVPNGAIDGQSLMNFDWSGVITAFPMRFWADNSFHHVILAGSGEPLSSENGNPYLTGAEAMSIDVKIDDGKPATGNVINYIDLSCVSSTDPSTATYLTTGSAITCCPTFKMDF